MRINWRNSIDNVGEYYLTRNLMFAPGALPLIAKFNRPTDALLENVMQATGPYPISIAAGGAAIIVAAPFINDFGLERALAVEGRRGNHNEALLLALTFAMPMRPEVSADIASPGAIHLGMALGAGAAIALNWIRRPATKRRTGNLAAKSLSL